MNQMDNGVVEIWIPLERVEPESYFPKNKLRILNMAEKAQYESKLQENVMIQPQIITKKFLLVGFETAIDLNESHWQGMDYVKASLKNNFDKIGHKINPARFIGIWEADQNADYSKPENHSKRLYFYGIEVLDLDDIPKDCIIKVLPESTFAVFREREHGSSKYDWLNAAGYAPDRKFQQKFALDMEIFNEVDNDGTEWDILIPIQSDGGGTK